MMSLIRFSALKQIKKDGSPVVTVDGCIFKKVARGQTIEGLVGFEVFYHYSKSNGKLLNVLASM